MPVSGGVLLACETWNVVSVGWSARALPALLGIVSAALSAGCGDQGFFPTTVEPGADFAVADIVFDSNYFYCRVEPVLFVNGCGSGDPSQGRHARAAVTSAPRPTA